MCSTEGGNSCSTTHQEPDGFGLSGGLGTENMKMHRFYSSRPGNFPAGSRKGDWESVYSCDSAIDRVEGDDDDSDSDPYDQRTKEYLDTHLEEIGYPGKDPLQLYADSKIAEVLARGTINEEKDRAKRERLKKTLPNRRIITPDFSEANTIIEEIEAALEIQEERTTVSDAFESIKAIIEHEFNENTVRFDNNLSGIFPQDSFGIVEVRKMAMELLNSELTEDEGFEDEMKNFADFVNSRITSRRSTEEFAVSELDDVKDESRGHAQPALTHENLKEQKCPEYPDSKDDPITAKKMVLMLKKHIYKVLKNHVTMIKNSENLMTFELFRIWNKNQEDALFEMAQDIVRREHDLRVTMKNAVQANRVERKMAARQKIEAGRPVLVPEKQGMKSRTKKAIECIRKREKLLRAKRNMFFLAGVLNGKLQCKGTLRKVWSQVEIKPGMPPRPPYGNRRVIDLLNECRDAKKRLMTYGDMLRLLQQDGEFTPIQGTESDEEQNCPPSRTDWKKDEESLGNKILAQFMHGETEKDCPLVTKKEYDDYLKILNELFFPDPNFKWIEDTLSFNPNAFVSETPRSLDMSYSLQQLENDTKKVFGFHGHLARVVYFFRYKTQYAAVDIQDAYERYVYENNAMDLKSNQHPFGCLLLYSNVAQAIVMVEGEILHVFNHFAGFRYSLIHKMIKSGRILYVRGKVSRHYFRKWVSIIAAPPLGVITYLTNSKKILNRVAEPRLYHFKEKLNRFYRIMSRKKLDETCMDIGENSLYMAPNPVLLFETCSCHTKKEEDTKRELHVPVIDLLPSPALVAYLLKYRQLKSFHRFLDEFLMQPELESEDETYNIVENTILGNYIESDGEEEKPKIMNEIKKLCREREILGKLRKELGDNMVKDTKGKDPPEWTKEYDIHSFNPQLAKVEVRQTAGSDVIRIDELADTEEDEGKPKEERFVEISYEVDKFEAHRRFVNFVQTGSEVWQKKIKRFGLKGEAVKEMLQDAQKYKKLQKVMEILAKRKVTVHEEYGEAEEMAEEEEEVPDEEERRGSEDSDIVWDSTIEELEKLLEQGEPEEFMGEQWPFPRQAGEGYEFFGEGKFHEYYGEYPKFEWDWKSDYGRPIDLLDGDLKGTFSSSEVPRAESSVEVHEEEESIPEAPPASSVTHSSAAMHHKKEIMSYRSGETEEEDDVKKVSRQGKCLKRLFRLTADETGRIKGLKSAFVVIVPKVVRVVGKAIPLITIIILLST